MLFRRRARLRMRCHTTTAQRCEVLDVAAHVDCRRSPAVLLRVNDTEPLALTPVQVGRLRAQLRDALFDAVAQAEQGRAEREEQRA